MSICVSVLTDRVGLVEKRHHYHLTRM